MIAIDVTGAGFDTVAARMRDLGPTVFRALKAALVGQAISLVGYIQERKLSGQVLNQRSRRLRDSIHYEMTETPAGTAVTVGTDVPYAAIHEYGGQTAPHDILPKTAQALRFMMGGREIFAKVVHHPGSKMPERSFLRSALADRKAQIVDAVEAAVRRAVETQR